MQNLIIIETSDIGARYTALAARRLGFEPLFVAQLAGYQGDTRAQLAEFQHIDMPTGNAAEIALQLRPLREQIGGVVTFLDSRLAVAVELAELLGVPGLEKTVLPLKDKGWAWSLAPDVMPQSLLIDREQWDYPTLRDFLEQQGKCILKPRQTAGAIGTLILDSNPGEHALLAHMNHSQIPIFLHPEAWILQKFSSGRLSSLEGFVSGGQFTALGVTGRRKIGQTETIANFPEDQQLPPAILRWVTAACRDFLRKAHIDRSYFHIEFIWDENRATLIDANVGRMGGGGIGELLAIAYGLDPVDVFQHVIATTLGRGLPNPYVHRRYPAVSAAYGLSRAAFVEAVASAEFRFHTLILDGQQQIPALGQNNWSWLGIATGPEEEFFARLDRIQIQTDSGVLSPCY